MRALPVINPRTGQQDAELLALDADEIAPQASAMRLAQVRWRALSPAQRAACLERWASAIFDARADLHAALRTDTGRDALAAREIELCIAMLRRWATLAPALLKDGDVQVSAHIPSLQYYSRYRPYALIGVISPWNFPLLLALIDTVPALAAGCAVLVKPSEVTPRFLSPLRATLAQIPELAEVCEFVAGDGKSGAALIEQVDMVCFTGSVRTGRAVYRACAERFIPCFLELGGKDPLVVLAGSDIDAATDCALRASVQATGQACQSIERIYVHASIFADFVRALTRKAQAIQLNFPDVTRGQLGPFIMRAQADIVAAQLADALAHGAQALSGGTIEELGGGRYLRPTVLVDVNHQMRVMREETFGPVLPVMSFRDENEAIQLANDSEFGLSAAVFGPDLAHAQQFAEHIEAGAISVNDAALTSVTQEVEKQSFKASGLGGSRMGAAGLTRFLRRQGFIVQTKAPFPLHGLDESEGKSV